MLWCVCSLTQGLQKCPALIAIDHRNVIFPDFLATIDDSHMRQERHCHVK